MVGWPALLLSLIVAVPEAGDDGAATPPPAPSAPAPAVPAAPPPCPDGEAVWSGVKTLVGARLPASVSRSALHVEDLGDRYRVSIAGRSREVADAARDCARRTQVATVFVALTLVPPDVPEAPPPDVAPLPPRVALRLELAPTLGFDAVSPGAGALLAGGLARVVVGGPRVAAVAGLGTSFGATQAAGDARVRERRVSVDAGVRFGWRGEHVEADLDVEALAAWLAVAPVGGASKGGTVDLGARVGGILVFGRSRIVPILGVLVDMSPAPRSLALEPDGVVGHASWLRASGFVGLGFRAP